MCRFRYVAFCLGQSRANEARRFLLAKVVELYVELEEAQAERFAAEVAKEGNEEVREMVITWEDALAASKAEGVAEGIAEGIATGEADGEARGLVKASARSSTRSKAWTVSRRSWIRLPLSVPSTSSSSILDGRQSSRVCADYLYLRMKYRVPVLLIAVFLPPI